jgi:RNase adapter protein RapZ
LRNGSSATRRSFTFVATFLRHHSGVQLVLVTGLSGSGKSVALNVLEDAGYYCSDNLPAPLLPELVATLRAAGLEKAAVSIDARTAAAGHGLADLPQYLGGLTRHGVDLRVLFLTAKDDTLIKRFSETRRRHPLDDGSATVSEYIAHERELLADLQAISHQMDTSDLRPNALREWIKEFLGTARASLTLVFTSFGFKHGIPLDADLVFDVRPLPNPYYDPELRALTGRDAKVIEFLRATPEAQSMLKDIESLVTKWLPAYTRDNRHYLTVAIGCTGGQHRSVYFAQTLGARFASTAEVLVRHREMKT